MDAGIDRLDNNGTFEHVWDGGDRNVVLEQEVPVPILVQMDCKLVTRLTLKVVCLPDLVAPVQKEVAVVLASHWGFAKKGTANVIDLALLDGLSDLVWCKL